MDWSAHFPALVQKPSGQRETKARLNKHDGAVEALTKDVEIADIGCGFGGLLFALAPMMPDALILGMSAAHNGLADD